MDYSISSFASLFQENIFSGKIKIFEFLDLKYKLWEISCQIGCFIEFFDISIIFEELDLNEFKVKGTFFERNIRKIIINDSKINSSFLEDILDLYKLKRLKIFESEISLEKTMNINNNTIECFIYRAKCHESCRYFYELVNLMTNLKRINFLMDRRINLRWPDAVKINIRHFEFLDVFLYKEYIDISEMKLLSNFEPKELLHLSAKCETGSLKCLFSRNNFSQVKNLNLFRFVIGNEDVKVFKNNLNLENIKFIDINLRLISISDLFCNAKDYNIKYIYLSNILFPIRFGIYF
ncbi:hypothetical protein CWI38_0587p0020 [Hamiltosporidium tvaerminnensis]|uniref:Uncharacterized protein n=1 Tax=Hamiltosporidium tvaerminnensis TaxID=1176355 RepID=A0A4V2JXS7_9MICR|nr:hypothetical protein CWI38_0587p0020 [Hamiltosporidium tvaerminnensis]